MDRERDLVVFTNDEGDTIEMEILDFFAHNGKEYAMLIESNVHEHDSADCCCDADEHENIDVYLMEVQEDGDEQRFIPVADDKMDELIEVINQLYREIDLDEEWPVENDEL